MNMSFFQYLKNRINFFFRRYIFSIPRKKAIKNYKYVHVMNNGIHSVNILKFIKKHFDNSEHCFIFPYMSEKTQETLEGVKDVYPYYITDISLKNVDKIIFQGFFSEAFIGVLHKNPKYLSKSYWYIWGGDLYKDDKDEKENFIKRNFKGILTSFDGDIYKQKYGEKPCYDVTYPHDMTEEMLGRRTEKNALRIMVNNSGDVTTLEMLDILSKFKDENIEIYTILSYNSANQPDSRLEIMKKGYNIFGQKFYPLISFIPKVEYAELLASIDIYISNQDRQQGNGNASFICSLGGKVYTKSDTSVYKKYNSLGIRYFDTYEIKNQSFAEFTAYDEKTKKQTIARLKERMKDETKVKQWGEFFNAV